MFLYGHYVRKVEGRVEQLLGCSQTAGEHTSKNTLVPLHSCSVHRMSVVAQNHLKGSPLVESCTAL